MAMTEEWEKCPNYELTDEDKEWLGMPDDIEIDECDITESNYLDDDY